MTEYSSIQEKLLAAFPKGLHGIIFDCDGVIIDSRASNFRYYTMLLEALGLPPLTREQEQYAHMHTHEDAVKYIVPKRLWLGVPQAVSKVQQIERTMPLIVLEPGIKPLLTWLADQKVSLGLVTNRSAGLNNILDRFGLSHSFNPVITAEMVRPKPHPEGLLKAIMQWQLSPENVLFVGDSLLDTEAAAAAGVVFAAYRNPKLRATLHLQQFPAFLAEIQAISNLFGGHLS